MKWNSLNTLRLRPNLGTVISGPSTHKSVLLREKETLVDWICPSPSTHAKVGRRPPICHPDWSAA